MNRIAPGSFLQRGDHRLQALLELAAILRAGQQAAHVERVDRRVLQDLRHLAAVDLERQPLGDGRLADAGVADVEGVVLAPPAEHVDRALDLVLAADQRIDVALGGALVEIDGEALERLAARLALAVGAVLVDVLQLAAVLGAELRHAVRDVAHHVESGDALALEQEDGVRVGLAEHRHQHVAAADLILAGRLHVQRGALQDAAEPERLLRLAALAGQLVDLVGEKAVHLALELLDVAAAVAQDLRHVGVVQQRVQHMLEGQILVLAPHGFAQRQAQRHFQLATDHHGCGPAALRSLPSCT